VLAALEQKRAAKEIGKSLEAKILLHSKEDLTDILPELAAAFIVSKVELADGEGEYKSESGTFSVTVEKAEGEKCERCWTYSETVGDSKEYPTLCKRCASVIAQ
jgi:isoleucyl-tRNA synthetase